MISLRGILQKQNMEITNLYANIAKKKFKLYENSMDAIVETKHYIDTGVYTCIKNTGHVMTDNINSIRHPILSHLEACKEYEKQLNKIIATESKYTDFRFIIKYPGSADNCFDVYYKIL